MSASLFTNATDAIMGTLSWIRTTENGQKAQSEMGPAAATSSQPHMKTVSTSDGLRTRDPVAAPELSPGGQAMRLRLLDRAIDLLIEQTKSHELWPEVYGRAEAVLKTIPLSSHGSTLAVKRLKNAQKYAMNNDHHAAAFELRMLRGQMISL